jgi:SAM-dependent methyltransferase
MIADPRPVGAAMRDRVRHYAEKYLGYDARNWLRVRQIDAFAEFLAAWPAASVLEISPGWNTYWKSRCRTYTSVDYPEFDICQAHLPREFDVVIADQVLEHVRQPVEAVKNMHRMLVPGGQLMLATPFLFRVHARPHDYNRWTEGGIRQLLMDGGFSDERINTHSWGNKACAKAHVGGPVRDYGWHRDMSNDPEYPMMVWAFAAK